MVGGDGREGLADLAVETPVIAFEGGRGGDEENAESDCRFVRGKTTRGGAEHLGSLAILDGGSQRKVNSDLEGSVLSVVVSGAGTLGGRGANLLSGR